MRIPVCVESPTINIFHDTPCKTRYTNVFDIPHNSSETLPPNYLKNQPDLIKYYLQRYEIFSKYEEGIKMDSEAWYSTTPEKIAAKIAKNCIGVGNIIVDAFCGVGGNTIQFALKFDQVIAVDIDKSKIEMAKINAEIYGVDNIVFINDDYMEIASTLKADAVFLSPPWGGPDYSKYDAFDIKNMGDLDGVEIFDITKNITNNIAYYLPKNAHIDQLQELSNDGELEIENNYLYSRLKAITAYYGKLANLVNRKIPRCDR